MYRQVLSVAVVLGMSGCADVNSESAMNTDETPASTQQNINPIASSKVIIEPIKKPFPRSFSSTIDFDTDPYGAAIAPGTDLSTVYTSSFGVTFKGILCKATCASAPVFANGMGSTNNVVALTATTYPGYDNATGAIEAWFSFATTRVTIQVYSDLFVESLGQTPTARPWLEAYDGDGAYLGGTYGTATPGVTQTMSVSFPNIRHVRFGSQRIFPWMYGQFDNLTYDFQIVRF